MPETPARKKRINWVVVLRNVHSYCSLSLFAVFFFFGLTGFLGNRADWFVGEPEYETPKNLTVPEGVELTESALVPVLSRLFPGVTGHSDFDNDGEETVVTLVGKDSIRRVMLINEDRTLKVQEWKRLPKDLPLKMESVTGWFAERVDGHLDEKSLVGEDEEAETIEFSLGSVWGTNSIVVKKAERTYQVSSQRADFVQALIDIHRSEHVGPWQRALVDITALLLVTVSATGALYGFVGKPRRRKRIAVALIGLSFVFLVFLIVGR